MNKLEAVGLFIILELLFNITVFIVNMIWGIFFENNNQIYTIAGLSDCITLLLLWLFTYTKKKSLINNGALRKISFKKIIYISLIGLIGSIFVSQLTSILIHIFPSYIEIKRQASNAIYSFPQLFSIIIIGPIYEEIIFREYILGHMKYDNNLVGSIILQAILFGLAHGNPVQFIYTSLIGIVFALIYLHYESILGSIAAHIVYNFSAAFITPYLNISKSISYIILLFGMISLLYELIKADYKKNI
ncbi:type II CAAX endopeptidase family protein [Bacillus sp. BAU-SS-2023]|nr:type II CAAX endopeptidase family protein [Bacillus sp. BAU-SS-2023]